jgi:putative holliday junction resolvase
MRILGLDLGTKTLGISMSDTTQTVATTFKTIRYENEDTSKLLKELKEITTEYKIETIVLGFPKNMNNSVGPKGEAALVFKALLEEHLNIKVEMQDERLSTKEATSYMIKADISRKKRKEKIDSLAANIILQTYLDKRKR